MLFMWVCARFVRMNRYRIIEKKRINNNTCLGHNGKYFTQDHGCGCYRYIPRYIVQEAIYNKIDGLSHYTCKDLKEFTNLEKSRKYKRDLELEEGIVIE